MEAESLMTPILQYGFAGFSAVLIAIIVWMIRQLIDILNRTNATISENTSVVREVSRQSTEQTDLIRDLRELIIVKTGD